MNNGKPKLLDLFCKAGGAGEGYRRAGFDVTGVDIEPQPNNPHKFVRADALEYLEKHGRKYDAIHGSPPCQGYSNLNAMHGRKYPMLIESLRWVLVFLGKPWVIENVPGAPLKTFSDLFGGNGVMLCGSMFGLGIERGFLRRHRHFELSFGVPQPPCNHPDQPAVGVYGHGGHSGKHRMLYRDEAAKAMGIDWMNRDELCQAIPPAYTEWLGRFLIKQL